MALPDWVLPALLRGVTTESGKELLKGVSRSFYLSLRLLPLPMRGAASLGYLLARTSDTLADSGGVSVEIRLECLAAFERSLMAGNEVPRWPGSMVQGVEDPRERRLLGETQAMISWLKALPTAEADLVRKVVGIIISGQQLDLERFHEASASNPIALNDAEELDDYTWRVAGCVGAFWTKLGYLTLGERFSTAPVQNLIELGISYGKGLQLVNILRDLPTDLNQGRCYLPSPGEFDRKVMLEAHGRWLERAIGRVGDGYLYAQQLHSRTLRAASVLPAMIARDTLEKMRGIAWEELSAGVKVSRASVYRSLLKAFWSGGA